MVKYFEKEKVHIPRQRDEIIFDFLGYGAFIFSLLLLSLLWGELPDRVPGHYNFAGEVTRWDAKGAILIMPLLGVVNGALFTALERFPEIQRFPKRYNEKNAPEFLLTSRRMMNRVKNILLIFFAFLIINDLSVSLGWGFNLGYWDFPLLMLVLGLVFWIGLREMRKIK